MKRNKIVLFIIFLSLLILLYFAYLDFENSNGTRTYPLVSVIILFSITLLFSNKILYLGIDSKILEPTPDSPDLSLSTFSIFGGFLAGLVIGIFLELLIYLYTEIYRIDGTITVGLLVIGFAMLILISIIGAFVGPLFKDFFKKILYK